MVKIARYKQGYVAIWILKVLFIQMDGKAIYSLVDINYDKHFYIHHGQNEFVLGKSHINGIEPFGSYAKI